MKPITIKITKIPKELEGHITAKVIEDLLNTWFSYGEKFKCVEVKK